MLPQEEAVKKAIKYIEENLNYELDLEGISKEVAYSKYHFSRIFKQITGENLVSMIKRLRLAQSAKEIIHKNSNITEIGFNVGYETSSSFNKAFKQFFGCSPSQYKKVTKQNLIKYKEALKFEPKIVDIKEDVYCICVREKGEYGEASLKAWNKLINSNLISLENIRYFGLCYDDPTITEYKMMRYEACLSIDDKYGFPKDSSIKKIPKGKYAVLKYIGDINELYDVSLQFYGWIIEKNLKLADFPLCEECLNNIEDILAGKVSSYDVNLYLLLES